MKRLVLAAGVAALAFGPLVPATAGQPAPVIHLGSITGPSYAPESGVAEPYQAEVWVGQDRLRNEPLELQAKESGDPGFETVATADTGADGHQAEVRVSLTYDAELRWHHPATAKAGEVWSVLIAVPVAARVGAVVSDRTLRRGQLLMVTGRIRPAKPGRLVRLRATTRSGSVQLASAYVRPDGTYRLTRRFAAAGQRKLFVTIPETSRNAAGRSTYRYVVVG